MNSRNRDKKNLCIINYEIIKSCLIFLINGYDSVLYFLTWTSRLFLFTHTRARWDGTNLTANTY